MPPALAYGVFGAYVIIILNIFFFAARRSRPGCRLRRRLYFLLKSMIIIYVYITDEINEKVFCNIMSTIILLYLNMLKIEFKKQHLTISI